MPSGQRGLIDALLLFSRLGYDHQWQVSNVAVAEEKMQGREKEEKKKDPKTGERAPRQRLDLEKCTRLAGQEMFRLIVRSLGGFLYS